MPRFPSSQVYAEKMKPIVACARRHMPRATVAAVGAPGKWNEGLRENAHMFDAVSWHAYEPSGSSVNEGGRNNMTHRVDRVSFVAGYGRAVAKQAVAQQARDIGVAKPIAHTEFGYGLDRPGHCVLDDLINGALHGAFHVSRIIEAINSPGTFAAITLESFVGGTPVAGPMVPVDPQAGNRTDYWCGLASSTVPTFHANRPDLARVAGTGQIFSHFAARALSSDTMHMHPVMVDNGPALHFPILGQGNQPCLQAAAFSDSPDGDRGTGVTGGKAGRPLMTLGVLNICNQSITATLQASAHTAQTTSYSLMDGGDVDPGPLNQRGWGPLPESPDTLPWTTGPLHPTSTSSTASAGGQVTLSMPLLTFTVVDVG